MTKHKIIQVKQEQCVGWACSLTCSSGSAQHRGYCSTSCKYILKYIWQCV